MQIARFCGCTYFNYRFNSAVFTTIAAFNFNSQVVAEDFFNPEIFPSLYDWGTFYNLTEVQSWDTKDPVQCLSAYRPNIITEFRNVYIVVSGDTTNRSRPVIDSRGSATQLRNSNLDCAAGGAGVLVSSCRADYVIKRLSQGIPWTVNGREVKGCRVELRKEKCKLQFSSGIMTVIILCNLLKVICMLSAGLKDLGSTLLVTIGDAVDSFIQEPDGETKAIHNAGKDFILNTWMVSGESGLGSAALVWKKHRWRESVSQARWCVCAVLCLAAVGVAAVLLKIGMQNDSLYMDMGIKAM